MDFFTIPLGDARVLYSPVRKLAFVGNGAMADYLHRRAAGKTAYINHEIEAFLQAAGFDDPAPVPPEFVTPGVPAPSHAVLLLTNGCNLRCVYCYANAGEDGPLELMPWSLARPVIDAAARNASARGEELSVTFHGGGEPTTHWELLRQAVDHARSHSASARISMSSNGVWTEAQREYVCRNFSSVSLSLDGLGAVQDRQRPRIGGGPTAAALRETLHALDEARVDYGIRMTVLPSSVGAFPDAVRQLCETTRASAIQVEPTFTDRPGHYADLDSRFADEFSRRFIEAWQIGRETGRHVYYSAARPGVLSPVFCEAPGRAMIATADGRLVTCFEVFSKKSPLAAAFTIGRVQEDGVSYDETAFRAYHERLRERRRECEDCFCYWHCSGDCIVRRPARRDLSQGRCRVTREITLQMLLTFIEEGGGIWRGARPARETSATDPSTCDADLS